MFTGFVTSVTPAETGRAGKRVPVTTHPLPTNGAEVGVRER